VVWAALGEVYRAKGEVGIAIEAFQNSLEDEKDNLWLQEVIRELEAELPHAAREAYSIPTATKSTSLT
jgi:hypothetical protein